MTTDMHGRTYAPRPGSGQRASEGDRRVRKAALKYLGTVLPKSDFEALQESYRKREQSVSEQVVDELTARITEGLDERIARRAAASATEERVAGVERHLRGRPDRRAYFRAQEEYEGPEPSEGAPPPPPPEPEDDTPDLIAELEALQLVPHKRGAAKRRTELKRILKEREP